LEESDPTIRAKARSSGYGITVPAKKEAEAPRPSFTPDVTKTEAAEQMRARARSSGYGKVAAKAPCKTSPSPDRAEFKPMLPEDPIRQAAPSSGYANGAYRPPTNRSRRESLENGTASSERVLKHSLLRDKPEPKDDCPTSPSKEKTFILDGVKVALTNTTMVKEGAAVAKLVEVLPPPHRSDTAKQLRERVHTQGYGKGTYTPPRGEKLHKEESPSFRFAKASPLDEPLSPVDTPKAAALCEVVKKNVCSQGYGSRSYMPPHGAKAQPVEELKFKFTKASVLDEAQKDPPQSLEEFATFGLPKTARVQANGD
jgi:hypothetical protein